MEKLTQNEVKRLLALGMSAGKIMLKNGAETYRVEDTIEKICEARFLEGVQVFAIPTGIFISVVYEGENHTILQRTSIKRIDLERIVLVNDFCREFENSSIDIEEGEKRLDAINRGNSFSPWFRYLCSGMAGGFFALLYGGTLYEFILAFLASSGVILFSDLLTNRKVPFFIRNIFGGMASAILSFGFVWLIGFAGISAAFGKVITGPLMTLVPGVTATNAIRDAISGDFVAGVSKLLEAILIAIALALGVWLILEFRIILGVEL